MTIVVGASPSRQAGDRSPDGWKRTLDRYAVPDERRSALQVTTTAVAMASGFAAMGLAMRVSYGLVLLLSVPTALAVVRLFILMHDTAHGSLFRSRRASEVTGVLLGVACWTPFIQWRRRHALHHATSGDLSRRSWADFPVATVDEFARMSAVQRLSYRITRSPSVLLTVGAWAFFYVIQRFPAAGARRKEQINLWGTNLAQAGIMAAFIAVFGWQATLAVWVPVAVLSASIGVWLFYVQHQFEEAYWRSGEDWSFYESAMRGSSLLLVPRGLLSWGFASVGFHHVHHLHPRIPNYRLAAAHWENPEFHGVTTLTPLATFACMRANLWDGERMISFRAARMRRA